MSCCIHTLAALLISCPDSSDEPIGILLYILAPTAFFHDHVKTFDVLLHHLSPFSIKFLNNLDGHLPESIYLVD